MSPGLSQIGFGGCITKSVLQTGAMEFEKNAMELHYGKCRFKCLENRLILGTKTQNN